jgi:hypothetical protein
VGHQHTKSTRSSEEPPARVASRPDHGGHRRRLSRVAEALARLDVVATRFPTPQSPISGDGLFCAAHRCSSADPGAGGQYPSIVQNSNGVSSMWISQWSPRSLRKDATGGLLRRDVEVDCLAGGDCGE